LVLTDQNMPRMDGLTFIQSLRKQSAYKDTDFDVDDRIKR